MGKQYKSPAKIARSILRLLDYKQAYLEDYWGADIQIDQQAKTIIWKASTILNLTLKRNVRIVETRNLYNPSFAALTFSEKLAIFQKMWKPDQDSMNFFTCMHEHLRGTVLNAIISVVDSARPTVDGSHSSSHLAIGPSPSYQLNIMRVSSSFISKGVFSRPTVCVLRAHKCHH
jgi:hypothetical protein